MKFKRAVFTILVCGLVLVVYEVSKAVVDVRGVEEVLKKAVLTQDDFKVIDDFMKDAVSDLVRTDDFTQVSKTRAIIVSHQGEQPQYAQKYSESAYAHILDGMEEARSEIRDPNRRFKVIANLLILIVDLKDPRLVDLAIGQIKNENMAVRYWAIRAATDTELWAKLGQNQNTTSQLTGRILTECNGLVADSSPEVLLQMAEFAGRSTAGGTTDLLAQIAAARAQAYATWSVKYALIDTTILKLVSERLITVPDPQLAKQFAQLYSYCMQRYIKGLRLGILSEPKVNHLASVLVETEEKCISRLLGTPQAMIRQAIEAKAFDALQAEHDRLFGTANQAGVFPSKFQFSYGSDDAPSQAPLMLPDPPKPAEAASATL